MPDVQAFWDSQFWFIHDVFPPVLIASAVFLIVLVVLFAFNFFRLTSLVCLGKRTVDSVSLTGRIGKIGTRIKTTLGVVFAQVRILSESYPGEMHLLIFWGAMLVIIGKVIRLFSYAGNITNPPQDIYLYASLAAEMGAVFIFIGGCMAIYRRYVIKPSRLDTLPDDTLVFGWVFLILLTGLMAKGWRIAAAEVAPTDWAMWSPVGYLFSQFFVSFPDELKSFILVWHRAVIHAVVVLVFFVYVFISRSRMNHLWMAPLNIFLRPLRPKGSLVPIELEEAETFGASKIEDFTMKQILDLEACTRCGRCQDVCPAYLSGKELSPKKLILDLKTHLHETYPLPIVTKPVEDRRDMVTEAVTEEVIWDCTTCLACEEVCPVYIGRVDKIVDMRRHLVLEECRSPGTFQESLGCIGAREHPWRGTTLTRTDWFKALEVKTLSESEGEVDLLYWVGCTAALDERNTKVAMAVAKILQAAGVNFAVLGSEEVCCGDPARRGGDEYLFQTLCAKNIGVLNSYNVKKILTSCPHCFNVLKNEYPQFDGNFEVIHHSQFIADLIRQGRLKLGELNDMTVTYHDSCYLGRYNDIYEEPRAILKEIEGVKGVELSRNRKRSFCCGGGGGHMWMEEPPDKRVNVRRVEEVMSTKASVVATACPYCLIMFEDGLKTKGVEETIAAKDLSELVVEAADLK